MEHYLRDLGHAGDGLDGEVAETVDRPGILVGFDEAAAIWRISQEVKSKLSICFDRVDATREKKSRNCILVFIKVIGDLVTILVKVVVHPVDVIRIYHCHCISWHEILLFAYLHSLVIFCNTPVGRYTSPVACLRLLSVSSHYIESCLVTYNSMPDGYVLDVWVLISNIFDCVLQPVREPFFVGFKIGPASTELVFAVVVLFWSVKAQESRLSCKTYKRLPIVVDDQICDCNP